MLLCSAGKVWANEIQLGQIKIPAVATELKTQQKAYSRIESAVITDSLGRVARGLHNVYVTVKDTAPYPLVVQGQEIKPGETKTIAVNLSTSGNRLSIPIHPSSGQIAGVAEYEVVINNIRVEVCPEYFTEGKIDCYRVLTQVAQPDCKLDMSPAGADTCTGKNVITKQTSCESGYTLDGNDCVRIRTVEKVKNCDSGYSLTTLGSCEKTSYTPMSPCKAGETFDGISCTAISLEAAVNGVCPEGTTASTTNPNYCNKTVVTVPALSCGGQSVTTTEKCNTDAGVTTCLSYNLAYGSCSARVYTDASFVCPFGFVEDKQGKCSVTQRYSLNNYCHDGYTMVNNTTCSKVETITGDPYCDTGYTLGGWTCSKSITQPAQPICASQYTWNGSQCEQTTTLPVSVTCSNAGASFNGSQCEIEESMRASGACSNGYWDGSSCSEYETSNATGFDCPSSHPNQSTVYSLRCFDELPSSPQENGCPGGYEWRLHRCVQYSSPSAIYCPSGFYPDGSPCGRYNYYSPDYYYCSAEWSLRGSSCYRTRYTAPNFNCPAGYVRNNMVCSKTDIRAPQSYSCPTGYTLNVSTCSQTLTAKAKALCPKDYTNVGDKSCEMRLEMPAMANCPVGHVERSGTCEITVSMPAMPQCSHPFIYDPATKLCKQEIRVPKYL